MKMIFESGGYVFLIVTDNYSANQKMFNVYHTENTSTAVYSVKHPCENPIFDSLYTFYDIVHCFKSIRNNWITEPTQTLEFIDPDTKVVHHAKFSDIITIYKEERESYVKETRLSYTVLFPNNFEKQKVQLACDLFNEKTVAALKKRGLISTALFVNMVSRVWNICNIKSIHSGYQKNDSDRYPFYNKEDENEHLEPENN